MSDADLLFKALADSGRRKLLDRLHAHDGQTLTELCQHLDMTRQGVPQHLAVLEAANLVAVQRRGREKLTSQVPIAFLLRRTQVFALDYAVARTLGRMLGQTGTADPV